jgi:hypothetical protein
MAVPDNEVARPAESVICQDVDNVLHAHRMK